MTQGELISFLESLGADVVVRRFGPQETTPDSVCAYFFPVPDPFEGIRGWEEMLLLDEYEDGWAINYGQYPRTRALQDEELKSLLTEWVREQDYRLFADYEPE
ncbi:MAG: hypothetical protein ACIAZJ_05025 [Gimesia chilikensis]|uniref:hypothetical protein n=1 Tax=Gimesia chilikensis TaxID=2605989 RepID=UPI0037A27F09